MDELVHYIRAGATVAIFTKTDDANPATDRTRYLHKDHLGSIDLVTDEAGLAAEARSFDPWGLARNPDWTPAPGGAALAETPRGFTDHEHIQTVGLIHMNGRVQDPVTGRFISPDPSDALNPGVGFNRYAYALNNPLSLVDPEGFETTPGSDDDDFSSIDEDHAFRDDEWAPERMGMTPEEYERDAYGGVEPFDLEGFVGTFTGIPGIVKAVGKFAVKQIGKLAAKNIDDATEAAAKAAAKKVDNPPGPYSHLNDHPSVGPNKPYTQAQKRNILAENRKRNGGELRSDLSGDSLVRAEKSQKGVTPPSNDAHVDHMIERCQGGCNSYSNARVLSREENLSRPGR